MTALLCVLAVAVTVTGLAFMIATSDEINWYGHWDE